MHIQADCHLFRFNFSFFLYVLLYSRDDDVTWMMMSHSEHNISIQGEVVLWRSLIKHYSIVNNIILSTCGWDQTFTEFWVMRFYCAELRVLFYRISIRNFGGWYYGRFGTSPYPYKRGRYAPDCDLGLDYNGIKLELKLMTWIFNFVLVLRI